MNAGDLYAKHVGYFEFSSLIEQRIMDLDQYLEKMITNTIVI